MEWYYPWGYVAFELIPGIAAAIVFAIVWCNIFGKKVFAKHKANYENNK